MADAASLLELTKARDALIFYAHKLEEERSEDRCVLMLHKMETAVALQVQRRVARAFRIWSVFAAKAGPPPVPQEVVQKTQAAARVRAAGWRGERLHFPLSAYRLLRPPPRPPPSPSLPPFLSRRNTQVFLLWRCL